MTVFDITLFDWIVLGISLGSLFAFGHFAWFPENLKELYMGETSFSTKKPDWTLPNCIIIYAYLVACWSFIILNYWKR